MGIVGAPIESNPTVALNLRLLGVTSATELGAGHGVPRPRAEFRRDPRARDGRHPERSHDAARAQRRHGGRCAERDLRRGARAPGSERRHQSLEGAGARRRSAGRAAARRRGPEAQTRQGSRDGRRLRQGHPARRARRRVRPARDRGADPAQDQGARRGLRRGHPSFDPALGCRVPAREQSQRAALVRAARRRFARSLGLEQARDENRGVPRGAAQHGSRRVCRHGRGHRARPRQALPVEA